MHFPKISEITTTDIISVTRQDTLSDAIDMMFGSEHRHIVVIDGSDYYMLSIYDVFRMTKETYRGTDFSLEHVDLLQIPTIAKEKNILDTLDYIRNDFEHMIAVNEDGSLYGLVTQSDILSSIDPDTLMDTYRILDLLKIKKRNRWVGKEVVTQEIFETMERYNHDAVMVVEERKPVGIITTKDMLRLLKEHADLSLPVKCFMSMPVVTVSQYCTLNEVLKFMKDKHFKRIVTVDEEGRMVDSITQKELISIAYTRWMRMMKSYQEELCQINEKLIQESRRFEKIAATDSLTGLYNRMKFFELFVSEYAVMTQRHNNLSLLLMDLDRFKKVNDTYGHNMGDEVLKQISNLLLRELRSVDILCRWGGEEFVALLPAADIAEAHQIAEKIRQSICTLSIEGIPGVTASIGVTQIREGDELMVVIERADKALYMAKGAGRNCIRCLS